MTTDFSEAECDDCALNGQGTEDGGGGPEDAKRERCFLNTCWNPEAVEMVRRKQQRFTDTLVGIVRPLGNGAPDGRLMFR